MNPKNLIVLAIGVAIAGFTGYMMLQFLNAKQSEIKTQVESEKQKIPPPIPTVKVLVAKSDLVVGTQIGRDNLHWQVWPQESVAPTYVVDRRDKLTDAGKSEAKRLTIEDFIGGTVRQPIVAGQPVTPGLVAKKGERGFMAAVLAPGMRAKSVGVSTLTGVAGFILPGDRVDIMWKVKKSSKPAAFVQTLFEDIRILAIDTKTQAAGATKAGSFTLELTPKQVEMLAMAQSMGSLEFVLRSVTPGVATQKRRDGAEDGLLQVSMGEGTRAGALIGEDILAVSREDERKEITRDRYTVGSELLYGKAPRKQQTTSPPPQATASTGPSHTHTGTSTAGRKVKITIMRGSKGQTIRIR